MKYKVGDVVETLNGHIIKLINIDAEWNKKTHNDFIYYTFEVIKKSNAFYMPERISEGNIKGLYKGVIQ